VAASCIVNGSWTNTSCRFLLFREVFHIGNPESALKHGRILDICLRLLDGDLIVKTDAAQRYGVTERSIQRDIDDLRSFFSERTTQDGVAREIFYNRVKKGYLLRRSSDKRLSNGEALTVCKILLESRSLRKDEMMPILEKVINGCVPYSNRPQVDTLISNEKFYYIEPHHGQPLVNRLWDIGVAVREQRMMLIEYQKLKEKETVSRLVKPVGLMFSEFYFYMTAFIERLDTDEEHKDTLYPTIYRIDRLKGYRVLDEHFSVPYKDRFQEGEFRKRVQFMYGGELRTVRFLYSGLSIEAVLDRLPTAKILEEKDGVYTVEAEVFGDGIDMWMRSQGDIIQLI
jgi:Predicted transcriptional regulator